MSVVPQDVVDNWLLNRKWAPRDLSAPPAGSDLKPVRGDAGRGLLDGYEAERLPLIRLTVQQAYTRYATRVVPERGIPTIKTGRSDGSPQPLRFARKSAPKEIT